MGFHAPAEAARILGESMNFTRMGQVAAGQRLFAATGTALMQKYEQNGRERRLIEWSRS